MVVSEVEVNGRDAAWSHETGPDAQELTVTPRHALKRGHKFTVEVEYGGTPQDVVDPDGSIEGWTTTPDGAFVVNEPQGSPGWYPANDNPRDKATFDIAVTVPEGITAIANGRLIKKRTQARHDDVALVRGLADGSLPRHRDQRRVRDDRHQGRADPALPGHRPGGQEPARLPGSGSASRREIIALFSDLYGRYPFSSGGGVVDIARANYNARVADQVDVRPQPGGHRLRRAGRIHGRPRGRPPVVRQRRDAGRSGPTSGSTRASRRGRSGSGTRSRVAPTAAETFDDLYATFEEWDPAPAAIPGPEQMFHAPPYDRGAMTLQALREKIGDGDFFKLLRRWYKRNRYGNVTTAQFIATAERVSGQQLDEFFRVWLFVPAKPTTW